MSQTSRTCWLASLSFVCASAFAQPQASAAAQATPDPALEQLRLQQHLAVGAADDAALRERVRQELRDEALMESQARAWGLDRQPSVRLQMEQAHQQVLVQAWRERVLAQTTVSEADLQQAYEREVARLGPDEVLVRHILVAQPQQADALIEAVERGGDFIALANARTLDDTTRTTGGLLGWLPVGRLIPAVKGVIDRLQPGQMWSSPVASDKGWHVLMLQARRNWQAPPLSEFRELLVAELQRQALQQRLEQLRQQVSTR